MPIHALVIMHIGANNDQKITLVVSGDRNLKVVSCIKTKTIVICRAIARTQDRVNLV